MTHIHHKNLSLMGHTSVILPCRLSGHPLPSIHGNNSYQCFPDPGDIVPCPEYIPPTSLSPQHPYKCIIQRHLYHPSTKTRSFPLYYGHTSKSRPRSSCTISVQVPSKLQGALHPWPRCIYGKFLLNNSLIMSFLPFRFYDGDLMHVETVKGWWRIFKFIVLDKA